MTTVSYRPVDQLAAEWSVSGRSAESRRALEALRRREPGIDAALPPEVGDLGDLVERLHRIGPTAATGARQAREAAAEVVRALLRSADADPMIPRALLQALVPGLLGVANRLSWGRGGDWEGGGPFLSDLVTTAWEVIADWAGQDRPYATLDLLSAVRCRSRRQLVAHRLRETRVLPAGVCVGDAP
jgi:hypothetical protein